MCEAKESLRRGGAGWRIGIDASNLLQGGGQTHLVELLSASDPPRHDIGAIVVWGRESTLALLPDRPWLVKLSPKALAAGPLRRAWWQRFELPRELNRAGCDLLFSPGGSSAGTFGPVVTMSRNMLPFEWRELRRYGLSRTGLRLRVLRLVQTRSFRHADGVIFLTDYAKQRVSQVTGDLAGKVAVIPHGVSKRFDQSPREQRAIGEYSGKRPYRLLYVSIVDEYKHQWNVVRAVKRLRDETGWPLVLDLVGPGYKPSLERLRAATEECDPEGRWVAYHGPVDYKAVHAFYARADLGIFASSCENMPNTLVETMAAGIPLASSNRGPMPETLADTGDYFDPEDIGSIANTLAGLISSPERRTRLATASHARARQYTWEACADSTLSFLAHVARTCDSEVKTCAA